MAEETAAAAPAAKPKSRKLLPIVLVVALVGAGGGAFAWLRARPAAAAEQPKAAERGLLALDTFVVNLADPGGSRFLRIGIQLVLPAEKDAKRIEDTPVALMRARSAILELLTQQTSAQLVTAEGKEKLKEAIAERATKAFEETRVVDVLFSEFVVQF